MEGFNVGDVILGKYKVRRILGQGGMGSVLEAENRGTGGLVALKVLLPSLRDNPDICARFAREARAVTGIKNEHVARVYDVDTADDGTPFLVMEHLEGEDLSKILRRRGALPVDEAVDLLLQACEAVAEAHTLGIVHRDLKPANLFVTKAPSSDRPVVKVLDFGISKSASLDDASLTAANAILGSPRYMSPEQFASSRKADARSDVWALGVILYELVAGAPPFAGDDFPKLYAAIAHGEVAPLSGRRPEVPAALDQAVALALAKEHDERIPTVEAFAARIAPFGTEAAQVSYRTIQRLTAPLAPPAAERASASPAKADVTAPGQVTDAAPVPVQSARERAASRAPRWGLAALGVAAALGATLALLRPGGLLSAASRGAVAAASASARPAMTPAQYEAACDAGSLTDCNALAALYAQGNGVPQDNTKAFALYKQSCDHGSALGCVRLGSMHYDGVGVSKNVAQGATLFLRGCNGGEPLGCLKVAVAYGEGQGVPKDLERSFAFAERACTTGLPLGCTRVGASRVNGFGVAKDVKGGLEQLDMLCTQGEPVACVALAAFYGNGVPGDVPADPLRLREYRAKACKLGDARSCAAQSALATMDSTGDRPAQVNAMFQKQCDEGHFSACGMLGHNLLTGTGASPDPTRGIALLEKGCKGGDDPACKELVEAGAR